MTGKGLKLVKKRGEIENIIYLRGDNKVTKRIKLKDEERKK